MQQPTLVLFTFLTACTINATEPLPDAGDNLAAFTGTWTYAAGSSSMLDCDNNALDMTKTKTGTFQIARGTMSDLIKLPDADDTCPPVRYDVTGNVASAQPGQTCMFTKTTSSNAMVTFNVMLTSSMLTVSPDGNTLTGTTMSTMMITGAVTSTCTASGTSTATKAGV